VPGLIFKNKSPVQTILNRAFGVLATKLDEQFFFV
jgi:hypothetical protein